MKSVTDLDPTKVYHCVYHFPQFRRFEEGGFVEELESVLAEDYAHKDYYHKHYPNWRELNEEYRKILAMMGKGRDEFVAACEAFMQLQAAQTSYIRHALILDKQGGVAELVSCCK